MREDKILKKIHQTQTRLRKEHQKLSWEEEAKLIDRMAQKIAKEYGYRVLPIARKPYSLDF